MCYITEHFQNSNSFLTHDASKYVPEYKGANDDPQDDVEGAEVRVGDTGEIGVYREPVVQGKQLKQGDEGRPDRPETCTENSQAKNTNN